MAKFRPSTFFWARLDGVGQDLGLDGLVVLDFQGFHHPLDPLAAEETHDVVLQGEVEAAFAGVALTAGTAAELIVDAPGFVALGAQDEQAPGLPDLVGLGGDDGLVLLHPAHGRSSGR